MESEEETKPLISSGGSRKSGEYTSGDVTRSQDKHGSSDTESESGEETT